MAQRALTQLKELMREARGSAGDAGDRVSADVESGSRRARQELARLWSQIEDLFERNVTPRARRAAYEAREQAWEGREALQDAVVRLRAQAAARPLLAVGLAVAATVLITSLLQSQRSRH